MKAGAAAALVTGADHGLGAAIAEALDAPRRHHLQRVEGARVVAHEGPSHLT